MESRSRAQSGSYVRRDPSVWLCSFALQPSPERSSHASLGETDKWIETRSVLENTTVERFLLEGEDTQAPHEESVKGPTLTNIPSPLSSSLDPIPAPCDERLSEPERDQLATPCSAYEEPEGPERRSTNVVQQFPDRVSPHLELLFAQLAMPVRWAMQSFLSSLPSWSRSVWWPAFLRHASHLLHFEHATSALSAGALGTTSISAPSYNTVIFPPLCGAPSVGVSSPRGGTRVPFYLVGDVVVAY